MKRIIAIIALVCPYAANGVQPSPHGLHGRTVGIDGRPTGGAAIIVSQNERQIAGTAADADGYFCIRLADGDYTLNVRFTGYDDACVRATVAGEDLDIGEIMLIPWQQSVGEVVVTADRIRRLDDRFVMEVGDNDRGKDAAELVAQSPRVSLSDSGLSINGAAAAKLCVDGREIRVSGEQLTAYLRRMRSEDIARIEVIPTASADHAADASAGMVCITRRRRRDSGTSISASYTALTGAMLTSHRPALSLDISRGNWTLVAAASATPTPHCTTQTVEQRTPLAGGTPYYDSRSRSPQHSNEYSARIGAFVDHGDRHSLGWEAEYVSNRLESVSDIETVIGGTAVPTAITGRYDCLSTADMLSTAADYTLRLDTLGSAFHLIADYTMHRTGSDNTYAAATTGTTPADTLYRNIPLTRYDIASVDASIEKHLLSSIRFKTGVRYTRTRLCNRSPWFGHLDGEWQPQTACDADNDYAESIAAIHATLWGETGRLSMSAGLRCEYTYTRKSGSFKRSYCDLFPNATTTMAFDDARRWILAVNYSRNIERPAFSRLDPARIQLSEYSYIQGNPDLRPTYIHRINATLIYGYRFTLTLGGNLHRDLIRELCIIPDADGSTSCIMPVNHHSENHWFAALNLPFRIGSIVNLSINAVGVNQRIRTLDNSSASSHNLLFVNATLQLALPAEFRIEASWSGHTRLYSGNSEVAPFDTWNLSIRKHMCRRRLTLHAGIYNIFDRAAGYATHPTAYNGSSVIRSGLSSRHFRAGISYSFTSEKKSVERRVKYRDEEMRRRLGGTGDETITKNH